MLPLINQCASYLPFSAARIGQFSKGVAVAALATLLSGSIKTALAAGFLALSLVGLKKVKATLEANEKQKQEFCNLLIDEVIKCIHHPKNKYSEETREQMIALLTQIKAKQVFIQSGSDDFRSKFVGVQGIFEHVVTSQLMLEQIKCFVGAIHTPTPATPLCTNIGLTGIGSLLSTIVRNSPEKHLTVSERIISIRCLLQQPEVTLHVIYPEAGLKKRTPEELAIFKKEITLNNGRLQKTPLNCEEMDPALVGATYLFADKDGNQYAFSIKAQQANAPLELSEWAIWFGPLNNLKVQARVNAVNSYVKENKGPDFYQIFQQKCLSQLALSAAGTHIIKK